MNAQQLYLESGKFAGVWFCGTCNQVYGKDEAMAESCCTCRFCGKECPRDSGDYTRMHRDCWRVRDRERFEERLAEAEEVTEYDGFVFVDGCGPQDGYFSSVEDAEEHLLDASDAESYENLPQWAFCCTPSPPPKIDASEIVERMADDMYEDAYDDFCLVDELQEALDKFWHANRDLISWNVDYSRKVRLFSDTKG